ADHNGMLTNLLHENAPGFENAPALCACPISLPIRGKVASVTERNRKRFCGIRARRSQNRQVRPETGMGLIRANDTGRIDGWRASLPNQRPWRPNSRSF